MKILCVYPAIHPSIQLSISLSNFGPTNQSNLPCLGSSKLNKKLGCKDMEENIENSWRQVVQQI